MSKIKKWGHSLLTVAGVALTVAAPAVQQTLGSHPTATAIGAGLWTLAGHWLPSPLSQATLDTIGQAIAQLWQK